MRKLIILILLLTQVGCNNSTVKLDNVEFPIEEQGEFEIIADSIMMSGFYGLYVYNDNLLADVVFMTSSVDAIPESLEIARQTNMIAWQNVVFALAVKAIVMVLGLMGYASMWLAVFADSGVAMLCVLNSIRLLYKK